MGNEELKEIFDAWKTKIREEKQKEGGSKLCVCVFVCVVSRCLVRVWVGFVFWLATFSAYMYTGNSSGK